MWRCRVAIGRLPSPSWPARWAFTGYSILSASQLAQTPASLEVHTVPCDSSYQHTVCGGRCRQKTHSSLCAAVARASPYRIALHRIAQVPFEDVPDLVAKRKVLLVKGQAYVQQDQVPLSPYDLNTSQDAAGSCSQPPVAMPHRQSSAMSKTTCLQGSWQSQVPLRPQYRWAPYWCATSGHRCRAAWRFRRGGGRRTPRLPRPAAWRLSSSHLPPGAANRRRFSDLLDMDKLRCNITIPRALQPQQQTRRLYTLPGSNEC